MQNLKLVIEGSYYDSQIYSGRLYLWTTKGSIITLDWDHLVKSIEVEDRLKLALDCAFRQSEYLYSSDFKLLFQDKEIKNVLIKKFDDLAQSSLSFSMRDLYKMKVVIAEQRNPFPFPHADSQIYSSSIYIGDPSGIFSAQTFKTQKREKKLPIAERSKRLWDGSALNLSAGYATLAIASGNDGLFELPLVLNSSLAVTEPKQVSNNHSTFVRWMYASIFSSSYHNDGYLAFFTIKKANEQKNAQNLLDDEKEKLELKENNSILEDKNDLDNENGEKVTRQFQGVITSKSIFKESPVAESPTYTWGASDKFCLVSQDTLNIVKYYPHGKFSEHEKEADNPTDKRFQPLGSITKEDFKFIPKAENIIRADSAVFGFIIELEDGLLIIPSDSGYTFLEGEPVNWRVFPKSKYYTNQLHAIYDDHLCVYSFNQDYFVDQKEKKVGIHLPNLRFPGKTSS
jgi:hypothetical protein